MSLIHLDISNFRNLASLTIKPLPTGFNLIYGNNGSGKTSFLEAIYYLSLGRSFRSSLMSRIIRKTADKFVIFAQVSSGENFAHSQTIPIGIERPLLGDIKIRIAGKDIRSTAILADLTPLQLINSHCFSLLDAGPSVRRKYLDWGIFYLKSDFLRAWQGFRQVLKQRNAALRAHHSKKELHVWTEELVTRGIELDMFRREYVALLLPMLNQTLAELLVDYAVAPNLAVTYYAGWDKSIAYHEILVASLEKDLHLGYTQFGPHRADLKITINKVPAKDILSRGQQKLFVCAMILAQGGLLASYTKKKPIYLIDDLPSELDAISRSNLLALLAQQETQIFITAVEREALNNKNGLLSHVPCKMFHVEHGNLTNVV